MGTVHPFVPAVAPSPAQQATKRPVEPYNLDPTFERALVALMCGKPRLFGKVAPFLEGECLGLAEARLAFDAAEAIQRDTKRPPDSCVIVLQRLRRWMGEGKVTLAQIDAVENFFLDAEDYGFPSVESVLAEIAPVLERRAHYEGITKALQEFQSKGDPTKPFARMQKATKIAVNDQSTGDELSDLAFEDLERIKSIRRLGTGIVELDQMMRGGPRRGTACMFLGSSTSGKSMGLVQVANAGALQGLRVAYATLELDVPIIKARMFANLTAVFIDEVLDNPLTCGAREIFAKIRKDHPWGGVKVKAFTPRITTPSDIFSWLDDLKEEDGKEVELLVVDYGDKLGSGSSKIDENSYTGQGNVYDQLFTWARDNKKWCWTASQSQRQKDKKKAKLGLDDVGDSMGKIRNFDVVITINMIDGDQVAFGIEKNRAGKRTGILPPLPTDYDCARIAPINLYYGV